MDEYEMLAFELHQLLYKEQMNPPRDRTNEKFLISKIVRYREQSRTYRSPLIRSVV